MASQKSLEMAAAIANKDDNTTVTASDYQVTPPYTPKIKSLMLDYTSSVEILPVQASSTQAAGHQPSDQMYHIHAFGHHPIQPEHGGHGDEEQETFFLPQYDHEGELYIGIRDLQPPQTLSILFQMAEGSADPDLQPVPIEWSYLSGDRWLSLHEGNIHNDTTRGMINSGIIEFDLQSVERSTRLDPQQYWIRAAIAQYPNSVCDTANIHAQAVAATFVDDASDPVVRADHYRQPLPKDSIKGLSEPTPEIAAVKQPYTSLGGKMAEQDEAFYTRVSERLRHKQRALTMWDYERLVLEHFPEIYKVKCLPANLAAFPDDPGKVEIIVIPDIRNKLPFDPFEPKAPADLIAKIETYLDKKSPTYAAVKVRNAHYIAVKVRFGVRFKSDRDEGFYKKQLVDELNRFLSPWAYEEGADIVIGGKIYANDIINFVDQRDYVDYVATIKLFRSEDGRTFQLVLPNESSGYAVTAHRPDGVLVAAQQHEIDIISDVGYEEESFRGINYMKVELDFVVD